MNYKHVDVYNAVQQVKDLHSKLATINEELARAKRDYSNERYRAIEAQKLSEFRIAREHAMDGVKIMQRNLSSLLDEREANSLIEQGKNEYISLIASGAHLTAHELALMLQKCPDNALLLRSVKEYAENNNLAGNGEYQKAFGNAYGIQNPEVPPRACVENLVNYLTHYAPADSAFNNPTEQQSTQRVFDIVNGEEHRLFEKLDNSI